VADLTGTDPDAGVPGDAVPEPGTGGEAASTAGTDAGENHEGATVRKGMSFAVASFGINGVLGLVGAVITSRLYGVDVMGQYALVIAPWVMLIQLSSVAERVALVREIAGLPARSPRVTGMFIPVLGFSVLLTIVVSIPVMLIAAAILNGPANQPHLVIPALCVVIAYILFDNTSANFDGIFSAFRSGRDLFIGRLVQIASFPIFAVLLVPWEKTVRSLTVATIVAMLLSLLVRLVLVRAYLTLRASGDAIRQGLRDLPALLKFGLKVVPGQLMGGFVDQTGTWVLGAVAPISVVGSWSRSFQLAQRMNEAGYRICEILYPTLVQRYREGDLYGFGRALARTIRFSSILMFLLAAVVGGAASGVLGIFGEGFQEASGAFATLLFLFAIAVLAMAFGQGIIATGHPHQLTITAAIRSVLALGLMVPGAILGGALGAALGLLLATLVEMVVVIWMMVHYVGRHCLPGTRFIIAMTAATAAGFGVSRALDLATTTFVGLLFALALGTAAFGGIVLGWALDPEERAQLVGRIPVLRNRL
jgi:O-antigen/teichoic acid export membrane protein